MPLNSGWSSPSWSRKSRSQTARLEEQCQNRRQRKISQRPCAIWEPRSSQLLLSLRKVATLTSTKMATVQQTLVKTSNYRSLPYLPSRFRHHFSQKAKGRSSLLEAVQKLKRLLRQFRLRSITGISKTRKQCRAPVKCQSGFRSS